MTLCCYDIACCMLEQLPVVVGGRVYATCWPHQFCQCMNRSAACSEMVRRWRVLDQLQNRNETLFYNVLVTHITEMAPIIYTPTVGWVCMNYHILFQKPRGMYLSAWHRGEVAPLVYNWPSDNVDAIVITDGSRVLGLGDQGLNGMGTSHPLPPPVRELPHTVTGLLLCPQSTCYSDTRHRAPAPCCGVA